MNKEKLVISNEEKNSMLCGICNKICNATKF
jgi:hypothetical protein